MVDNYSVTEFNEADQAEVKEFVLHILLTEFGFEPNPVWDADLDDPDKKYKAAGGVFYVMKDKEKVIGTVALYPHSETEVELKRLYIDSSYRGQGLGKTLLNKALDFCKDKNYKKVVLDSWERLKPALKLYEEFGFKEYKREGEQIFMALDLK